VLVSGTVYGTVVGCGLTFEDRGYRELKGVPGKWPIFALCGSGVTPGDGHAPAPSRSAQAA
jgi:hypothetical protein